MISGLPTYITAVFLATVLLTFFLFMIAGTRRKITGIVLIAWLVITGILAWNEFFLTTDTIPPRLAVAVVPAVLFILILVLTKKGNDYTRTLDLRKLTLLHIVRIPVEIVLYWLAAQKLVPELMTFAGRNFDILSGLTAPVMYFVCFKNGQVRNKGLLLAWNIICLLLLLNIVVNAILSAPTPIQQFAFDQPNIAVLFFPFTWLPAFIVMLVLFSHLVAIKRLSTPGGR